MKGQLFTIDLLAAGIVLTATLGMALYLDASLKTNYDNALDNHETAQALADILGANQTPATTPSCWCTIQRNTTNTIYENCSTLTCFDYCTKTTTATRLSPYCVGGGSCNCNSTPCAIEVRLC
ncbi:TPA: hypothetical protein HA318_02200 [Candidatus Micrarchaeota archaeon]|nr:MAG: hypothetical protein AUJ65_05725 [Candidatus Micrarchaeota archaeon CG1_02_51_15]HII38790.1 hypothetical protein [Candidatus Micrarchaeota archaeon]